MINIMNPKQTARQSHIGMSAYATFGAPTCVITDVPVLARDKGATPGTTVWISPPS